jgi:methyl-accepting chemotaxis protein
MKWTVGAKIGLGFGLALVFFLVVNAISYRSTIQLTQSNDWVTHSHLVLEELAALLQGLTDAETGQRGFILTGRETYLEPYNAGLAVIGGHMKTLKSLTVDNPRQQQRLPALQTLAEERMNALKKVLDLQKPDASEAPATDAASRPTTSAAGSQRSKEIEALRNSIVNGGGKKEMEDIRTLIAEMKREELALLQERVEEAQHSAQNTRLTILIGTSAAFLSLFLVAFGITRSISRPLGEISGIAEKIAQGDLSINLSAADSTDDRTDEIGVLARAFTRMIKNLRAMADVAGKIAGGDLRVKVKPQSDKDLLGSAFASMVENLRRLTGQIAQGVNVLSSSANQILTTTTQLASSSSQTAVAIAETTTTVEEVRQTAQIASQKSRTVSESAQKVAQTAYAGRKSTEATIEGMGRIRQQMESIAQSMVRLSDQTQAVGQIIATVDDLAAQSNLLAVNASIEAAKAGEQGKGFAVVAQEVRGLAEQSKQATNQVRTILSDIQKATSAAVMATEQGTRAVEAGVTLSGETDQSIQSLSSSVVEAAQTATQIAASSQQQLVGVDQVASAMESIKQASMQSVAGAKQLEAASGGLKELGNQLRHLVEHYKI